MLKKKDVVLDRSTRYRGAGFIDTPNSDVKVHLTGEEFWTLFNEGWKLVIDEDGSLISAIRPSLEARLANMRKVK